ncbi:hypothetical protein TWF696_001450 [Orbilia brochopaga]|uniref:F-box domain-containing protein n=1 Tax=Orbilia brochopaga TaxID=3140254 RepID=A0AAV9U9H8_9PEZI
MQSSLEKLPPELALAISQFPNLYHSLRIDPYSLILPDRRCPCLIPWAKEEYLQHVRHYSCIWTPAVDSMPIARWDRIAMPPSHLKLQQITEMIHGEYLLTFEWNSFNGSLPHFIIPFLKNCPKLQSLTFPLSNIAYFDPQDYEKLRLPALQKLRVFDLAPTPLNMMLIVSLINQSSNLEHLSIHADEFTSDRTVVTPNPPVRRGFKWASGFAAHISRFTPIPDLKTLVALSVYSELANGKALRSLCIEGLPLDSTLGDYLAACNTLENLTIRNVSEVQDVGSIFQQHQFKLRRLHILSSHAQLAIFRSLVENLLPGLETLIFLTSDRRDRGASEDTETLRNLLTNSAGERTRYVFNQGTLDRHSATLKRLAIHDNIYDALIRFSPRQPFPQLLGWGPLKLTEFSTTCNFNWTSLYTTVVTAPTVAALRDTLQILYLVPDDVGFNRYSPFDGLERFAIQIGIHQWLRSTYRDIQHRPPLRYIIYGLICDLLFVVDWVPNRDTSPSSERWLSTIQRYGLAKTYPELRGETFELYDVDFQVDSGRDLLPPFRYHTKRQG